MLQSIFSDVRAGLPYFKVVQLIGPKGTGKTTSTHLLLRYLSSASPGSVAHVYLNLRALSEPSPWVIYSQLITRVGGRPSRNLSAGELFEKFVSLLQRDANRTYVVTVDEAEQLTGYRSIHGGQIVYNLTRLPEFGVENVSGVIFISREEDWASHLAPEERSSLGALIVRYPAYTRDQLVDILLFRSGEAFVPGALSGAIIEYLAEVTEAVFESDLRRALDVLLLAGQIADSEKAGKVSIEHLNKAIAQSLRERYLFSHSVDQLGTAEKVVLLAVLLASRQLNQSFVAMRDVYKQVALVCENYGMKSLSQREQEEALQRLADEGYIQFRGPLKIYVTAFPSTMDPSMLAERLLGARRQRA
ncbi:AAA family ATPase [Infirmifilum lucidum]|uniref:AAA family ATPase n=2 Tax=Infirmifilum lucidum TaxID=2776706 RepID=A0A7L9FKW3_9CREN|nr:AAA family ATPase [Infirmifilum lucidum]